VRGKLTCFEECTHVGSWGSKTMTFAGGNDQSSIRAVYLTTTDRCPCSTASPTSAFGSHHDQEAQNDNDEHWSERRFTVDE
jgi:hypothetical protein